MKPNKGRTTKLTKEGRLKRLKEKTPERIDSQIAALEDRLAELKEFKKGRNTE